MGVGVAEAAQRLHLTQQRVRQLIRAGLLEADQVSGVFVVDEDSLDQLNVERPAHVRSFSPKVAWAAAALADGQQPSWLSPSELSRLRARMTSGSTSPAAWATRLRSAAVQTHTFRAGTSQLPALLNSAHAVRGGVSATVAVGDRLVALDAAELWVADIAALRQLTTDHGLVLSSRGNLTVRCAGLDVVRRLGTGDGNVFRMLVATDRLTSHDARTYASGRQLLAAVLDEQKWRR